MRDKSSNLGDIREEISVWEALLSAGVELQLSAELLFNQCDAIEPEVAVRQSGNIFNLSQVLGAVLTQHEPRLKVLAVRLPDGMSAMTVRNPYYSPDAEEPPDTSEGSTRDLGGDIPF